MDFSAKKSKVINATTYWSIDSLKHLVPCEHDDEQSENRISYNDNLVVTVRYGNSAFDVTRRFLLQWEKSANKITCSIEAEPNWAWDEHGDLSEEAREILNYLLDKDPSLFTPPNDYFYQFQRLRMKDAEKFRLTQD